MSVLNNLLEILPFMTPERADIVISSFWPMLKGGLYYSIPLTILAFTFGMLIALAVALLRVIPRHHWWHVALYGLSRVYVSAIRGTPLLVQLFIIFYGLPSIGVTLDPFISAVIGFSLNVGAYGAETIRGAIMSIPKGQWEAGFTIGMPYIQTFRRIILPQAIRVAVPPLSNTFISLIKDSSLASLILVAELFKEAQIVAARTYEFMLVYTEAALIYWMICFLLGILQTYLENRLSRYTAKS